MKAPQAVITLRFTVPLDQHKTVKSLAAQLVREGRSTPLTAMGDAYAMLIGLAIKALEATEDDAAAACTVAA